MTSISKTQRHLDLIAYLVGRHLPVAVEELMEHVPSYAEKWRTGEKRDQDSVRRTFERDKKDLRELGIPIETVTFTTNYGMEEAQGYRLARKDFYLPYLRLLGNEQQAERTGPRQTGAPELRIEARDADAAVDALQRAAALPSFPYVAEARSALRKLSFDLDVEDYGSPRMLFVEPPGADDVRERVRVLSDALQARKRVRFGYHGMYRGEPTDRDVAPWGLLFQLGHWYLIGHDATRDALRVFRVGRMEEVRPNTARPGSPDYEIPSDFDLRDYADRNAWELNGDTDDGLVARILFRFPLSLWAARNGYGELAEETADGGAVRVFDVHQVDPFLRWLLGLGGDAQIIDPPELREALTALADRIARMHHTPEDDG